MVTSEEAKQALLTIQSYCKERGPMCEGCEIEAWCDMIDQHFETYEFIQTPEMWLIPTS